MATVELIPSAAGKPAITIQDNNNNDVFDDGDLINRTEYSRLPPDVVADLRKIGVDRNPVGLRLRPLARYASTINVVEDMLLRRDAIGVSTHASYGPEQAKEAGLPCLDNCGVSERLRQYQRQAYEMMRAEVDKYGQLADGSQITTSLCLAQNFYSLSQGIAVEPTTAQNTKGIADDFNVRFGVFLRFAESQPGLLDVVLKGFQRAMEKDLLYAEIYARAGDFNFMNTKLALARTWAERGRITFDEVREAKIRKGVVSESVGRLSGPEVVQFTKMPFQDRDAFVLRLFRGSSEVG